MARPYLPGEDTLLYFIVADLTDVTADAIDDLRSEMSEIAEVCAPRAAEVLLQLVCNEETELEIRLEARVRFLGCMLLPSTRFAANMSLA